jgi:acylphosphatase
VDALSIYQVSLKGQKIRKRAHVLISGRVQGVFFRVRTTERALRLGVMGWVRNLPNGKVEAVFEGEEERVASLIEFCRHGPSYAVVKDVDVTWETPTGEFESFEMKHG